jgi:hypothetical protein
MAVFQAHLVAQAEVAQVEISLTTVLTEPLTQAEAEVLPAAARVPLLSKVALAAPASLLFATLSKEKSWHITQK